MRLSLVIPTVDRSAAVYNLLRHLERQTAAPHEILVVDQSAEPDARVCAYAAEHPEVRYLRLEVRSLPVARNFGVERAAGDAVLFLDDDSIPEPDLVRFHAAAYADESVAGVGGRVRGGYDRAEGAVGAFRTADGRVIRNFGSSTPCDVEHLPGGNMSFRREIFGRLGGFDPAYGGSSLGEETDFCLRARRAGFRLIFEPRAALEHLHLPTGGVREPRFETWLYWHAHNGMLFALRHARAAAWPLFVARRVLRFGLFALERGSPSLLLTGLRGLMRGATTHVQGS